MLTIKNSGANAFSTWLLLVWALLLCACQPPGPKALLDGERLIREGQYERAIKRLTKASELLPGNPQVWNHLGLAYHGAGKFGDAQKAYQQALTLDRNLAAAHYNLGNLHLEQNRFQQAITELTIYTLTQPENPNGWLKLGTAYLRARNPDDAERAFMNALKISPKDPEIHNNMGLVHLQRKRPRDAIQSFNAALQASPGYAPAILNQALVAHYHLGNKQGALERYQAYLATKPMNADEIRTVVHNLQEELKPTPVVIAPRQLPTPTNIAASQPATPTNTPPPVAAVTTPTNPPVVTPPLRTNAVTVVKTNPPPQVDRPVEIAKPVEVPPKPVDQPKQSPVVAAANSDTPTPPTKVEPKPEPEPEPEPEPIPVEVVQLDNFPTIKAATDRTPSTQQPASNTLAANTQEERPLLAPRRREEKPGVLERVNPLRWFNNDEQPSNSPQPGLTARPTSAEPEPVRRVQEEPAPPPAPRYPYRKLAAFKAGRRAEAERLFSEGAQAHQQRRLGAAMDLYRRAISADPSYFEPRFNLGLAAYQADDLPVALAASEEAVAIRPTSANARYNFAIALRDANYPLDAINELRQLLVDNPDDARAHYALGTLYAERVNQPALAERHYKRVLEINPNHPEGSRIRFWLTNRR